MWQAFGLRSSIVVTTLVLSLVTCTRETEAQVVGGYRAIAVTDKDAQVAAELAVESQSKTEKATPKLTLGKITKAEVQVVAGRNFRLQMDVKSGDKVRRAKAVVWAKLDRTHELTSWEWLDK